ncbi:hypothetical protein [Streptomyces niveus]|uniref:hypothetical protein n=1 Tax=Streptomyces niveus TaxID=193462 RepID=UPI0035D8A3D7
MYLHVAEFFAELCLPFHDSTFVGNTYYAIPIPDTPLRLRIDFSGTIYADTYGGLRLAVVHPDRGVLDAVASASRITAPSTAATRRPTFGRTPRRTAHSTSTTADRPPWEGAVSTGLRDAIEQYTTVRSPRRLGRVRAGPHPAGRTARKAPTVPDTRNGSRAH